MMDIRHSALMENYRYKYRILARIIDYCLLQFCWRVISDIIVNMSQAIGIIINVIIILMGTYYYYYGYLKLDRFVVNLSSSTNSTHILNTE